MNAVTFIVLSTLGATGNSRGVLLDFSATWCGPCQQMNPVVHRLQRQGYPVRQVDIDREPALAQKYGIRTIPAFVLVVDGQERNRIQGITSESQLKRLLKQIPTTPRRKPTPRNARGSVTRSQSPSNPEPRTKPRTNPKPRVPTTPIEPGTLPFDFPFSAANDSDRRPTDRIPTQPVSVNSADTAHLSFPGVLPNDADNASPSIPRILSSAGQSNAHRVAPCSVRIRMHGAKGVNFGSGTIITSTDGQDLILTCGHIFRTLSSDSVIEVDVFTLDGVRTNEAELVDFDLESDVGLVAIHYAGPLPTATVAAGGYQVQVDQPVVSIGCSGGEPPSRADVVVTAIDRYLGPSNTECTGIPVRGRSGGGLFTENGEIVGVCVAADPSENRGLYAGLPAIQELLKRSGHANLFRSLPTDNSNDSALFTSNAVTSSRELIASSRGGNAIARADTSPQTRPFETTATVESPESLAAAAAKLGADGAEVICIVRPLDQPRNASRVVIINRASPRFVSYLTDELNRQPQPTSGFVASTPSVPQGEESLTLADQPPFTAATTSPQTAPQFERYRRTR